MFTTNIIYSSNKVNTNVTMLEHLKEKNWEKVTF